MKYSYVELEHPDAIDWFLNACRRVAQSKADQRKARVARMREANARHRALPWWRRHTRLRPHDDMEIRFAGIPSEWELHAQALGELPRKLDMTLKVESELYLKVMRNFSETVSVDPPRPFTNEGVTD